MIRSVQPQDIASITSIYNYYIEHTAVTFEESVIDEQEMNQRVNNYSESLPWLVFEENKQVIAYAYATPWKGRSAYRFSVETSIYVDQSAHKNGIGTALYTSLIERLKAQNYHALIGGITLPNEASIRLHEKLGFEKIGEFKEVGFKFGEWRNVGYWQLILPNNKNQSF
ncbi:MAG: N-acetyltransferase [Balneolaceae bacterium]|nr:N-acetyltransferase [Balneolaceae bacterium]